jgi:tight adherence protein C
MLTDLSSVVLTDGLMPLAMMAGLMLVGAALIFSGMGERTKAVARRIDMVQGNPDSEPAKAGRAKRPEERITSQPEHDISEAEHRQIVRIYARFGIPPESARGYYQMTRLVLALALGAITFLFVKKVFASFFAAGVLCVAFPAAIGWFLPSLALSHSLAKRKRLVSTGLPDALELLAVCIESGLSLENGLQRVSNELKRSQPALGDELAMTWAEINILPDRDQALLNFAARVDTPSARTVVNTLSQTLRYGTPLARSLRVVAADVRMEQLTAMEEKANRLPALMTVPVMLFIMPTLFLIIGGPAALKLMDAFFK